MATAAPVSELRVVLLGDDWTSRSSVGNLLFGYGAFTTEGEPSCCVRGKLTTQNQEVVVIITPNLLHPDMTEDELRGHTQTCVSLSEPGAHVFLLVLQPEEFTEEHKLRLLRILKDFSEDVLSHSLVLIATCGEESSEVTEDELHRPSLKDLIRSCSYRYLRLKNLERSELLTRLGQIANENSGERVSCGVSEDTMDDSPGRQQRAALDAVEANDLHLGVEIMSPQYPWIHPGTETSGIRILLLGKSNDKKNKLQNFIIRDKTAQGQSSAKHGQWRGKKITVVKTPNVFDLSVRNVRTQMQRCTSLIPPGPHVLLLLARPSDFTEENRNTLRFILTGCFGPNVLHHSMFIRTHDEDDQRADQIIEDCGGRWYRMTSENYQELMKKIENIVDATRGSVLTPF